MADIDVKPKRSSIVPWIIGLLVLALIVWLAMETLTGDTDAETIAVTDTYTPTAVMPMPATEPSAQQQGDMAAILANPAQYVGQSMPSMQVQVAEVPTNRGFWVQDDSGHRLFAIVIDQPAEEPIDINTGQTLEINGGTLRDQQYLGQIAGEPLDDQTRSIAQSQQVYLVVNESNLNITERT